MIFSAPWFPTTSTYILPLTHKIDFYLHIKPREKLVLYIILNVYYWISEGKTRDFWHKCSSKCLEWSRPVVYYFYIFTLLYIIPSTQHISQTYGYIFRLNKSSSGVSKNHKLITICLCTFGIPQADPPPNTIHRKVKSEKTENHDGHNQDHENNGPKKQHTRHPPVYA